MCRAATVLPQKWTKPAHLSGFGGNRSSIHAVLPVFYHTPLLSLLCCAWQVCPLVLLCASLPFRQQTRSQLHTAMLTGRERAEEPDPAAPAVDAVQGGARNPGRLERRQGPLLEGAPARVRGSAQAAGAQPDRRELAAQDLGSAACHGNIAVPQVLVPRLWYVALAGVTAWPHLRKT